MSKKSEQTGVLLNPATGEVITALKQQPERNLLQAVARARAAQKQWQTLSVRKRCRCIRTMRGYLTRHAERFTQVISRCTGKTKIDALSTEIIPALMAAEYYERNAHKFLKCRHIRGGPPLFFYKKSFLYRVPYGVVAVISPWNYPFGIPFHEVIIGLLSGNAVILKVATQVQPVGALFQEMLQNTGLPDGLFYHCLLPGKKVSAALLKAGIKKLFFTGSTAVGKALMRQAASFLVPVSLELGGNNPMLVLRDAPLFRAACCAVWAGMSNCGQSCGRVQRLYVVDEVYEKFKKILCARVENLTQGYANDSGFDIGSLTTQSQYDEVQRQVNEAVKQGACIIATASKSAANGLFFPPLVLETANPQLSILKQEVFGPVLIMVRVKNPAQAVILANTTGTGLTASVWSKHKQNALRIAGQLETGSVTTNDHLMSHAMAQTPWGGFKQSGIGRTHARLGFEEMTQAKVIVHDRLSLLPKSFWWHPHSNTVYRGLIGLLHALSGLTLMQRLKGFAGFIKLALRSLSKE
ncbi:MAG: aldehyde dehydrogenase family protein [Spirochaetales bacterium]|nr:aldehyde dehydrogenase family protein [Spirochaetales bacterium]